MEDRDWIHALAPAVSTAIFAILAYCHQGTVVHRSTWDRQNLWLPIVYALCPHIYICQILLNIVLCLLRNRVLRNVQGATAQRGDFWFYVCAILGMHTCSRDWPEPGTFDSNSKLCAVLGQDRRVGMLRLHDLEPDRLQRWNKYTKQPESVAASAATEASSTVIFLGRSVAQLALLFQGIYGSLTYIKRVRAVDHGMLDIDHIAGTYVLSGTLVTMSSVIMLLQPYEWHDTNQFNQGVRDLWSDVDTNNAWVYETSTALIVQLAIWISLKLKVLMRMNTKSSSISSIDIALAILFLLGTLFWLPCVRDVFIFRRHKLTWLNQTFRLDFDQSARVVRLVVAVLAVVIATATWWKAGAELSAVRNGIVTPLNANWTMPNPKTNTVLDTVWCLYC